MHFVPAFYAYARRNRQQRTGLSVGAGRWCGGFPDGRRRGGGLSSLLQLRTVVFLPSRGRGGKMGVFSEAVAGKKRAFPTTSRESTSCRGFFDHALAFCVPHELFFFWATSSTQCRVLIGGPAFGEGAKFQLPHRLPRNATPPRKGPRKIPEEARLRLYRPSPIFDSDRCPVCSGQRSSHRQLVIAFDRRASPEISQIISSAAPGSSRSPRISGTQPAEPLPAVLAAASFPRFHWLP